MAVAREISHKVYFTENGVIVEHGSPEQIFGAPQHARTREFLEKVN
jgi:polar amino acid transport system ATP-binding protein